VRCTLLLIRRSRNPADFLLLISGKSNNTASTRCGVYAVLRAVCYVRCVTCGVKGPLKRHQKRKKEKRGKAVKSVKTRKARNGIFSHRTDINTATSTTRRDPPAAPLPSDQGNPLISLLQGNTTIVLSPVG